MVARRLPQRSPGFHTRAAAPRQSGNVRQTLESGLSAFESGKEGAHSLQHAGSTEFHVPRAGSPTPSLMFIGPFVDEGPRFVTADPLLPRAHRKSMVSQEPPPLQHAL